MTADNPLGSYFAQLFALNRYALDRPLRYAGGTLIGKRQPLRLETDQGIFAVSPLSIDQWAMARRPGALPRERSST
jgi:hypothetical protein